MIRTQKYKPTKSFYLPKTRKFKPFKITNYTVLERLAIIDFTLKIHHIYTIMKCYLLVLILCVSFQWHWCGLYSGSICHTWDVTCWTVSKLVQELGGGWKEHGMWHILWPLSNDGYFIDVFNNPHIFEWNLWKYHITVTGGFDFYCNDTCIEDTTETWSNYSTLNPTHNINSSAGMLYIVIL